MADEQPIVGSVEVVLYAALRGSEPKEVGTLRLPLKIRNFNSQTNIETQLTEVLSYVAEDVKAVFGEKAPSA